MHQSAAQKTIEIPTDSVRQWLVNRIAEHLDIAPEEIDTRDNFASYGLGSRTALEIAGELEMMVGRPVEATLVWDHPTIDAVVEFLTQPVDSDGEVEVL